jgi:hypothetical protein
MYTRLGRLYDELRRQESASGCITRKPAVSRLLVLLSLCAALALLPASAGAVVLVPPGPSGQFLPAAGDRDGDGVPDAYDCAPDDPTRPSRGGDDANCDGQPDGEQAASSDSDSPTVDPAAVARDAAHGAVTALRWPLGGPVTVFAPRADATGMRTLIFVATDNAGLTVTHRLDRGATATNRRSLARGGAYVLPIATRGARRLRVAVTVVDAAGESHRVVRTLRLR